MEPACSDGLLVLDKPPGLTSRDVVDRALHWFAPGTRAGHAGTLDPLATGVLVLCVGAARRLIEYVQRMEKSYHAGLLLGALSTTDDADGKVEPVAGAQPPERARLAACLETFIGEIEQVPPAHSAAKVSGRRAYDLARRGQPVSLAPRRVRIHALELVRYAYPRLELVVRCGKGTYIRSLARDLGEKLGCGALVEQLRRTRIGPFAEAGALALESDTALVHSSLLPLGAAVVELPHVTLHPEAVRRLRQGQAVAIGDSPLGAAPDADRVVVAVFDETSALAAVAVVDRARRVLRPEKVFPTGSPIN